MIIFGPSRRMLNQNSCATLAGEEKAFPKQIFGFAGRRRRHSAIPEDERKREISAVGEKCESGGASPKPTLSC